MSKEMPPHVLKPYLSSERIRKRIEQLASELVQEYTGVEDQTVFLCVLKGGFVFAADLMRSLALNVPIEFCRAQSYGDSMESSGQVDIQLPDPMLLTGRYVVLIEDIVDTGTTLKEIVRLLHEMAVKRVEICSLLSKPSRRKTDLHVKYIGFEVPDLFFVGYGLDYAELYRNLDYLAVVVPQKSAE
ncbi:MAG: hypoxanthine phosphoribosyltransferase [Planctomycetota bacterium]